MSNLGIIIADFNVQLITQIDPGGTTGKISSVIDDDGVTLPAGNYFFTLDGVNSQKEHIYCALDTSGNITSIQSVSRQAVKTTGVTRQHRVGATVTITDFAHIAFLNNILMGSATLDGANPIGYDVNPTLTNLNQLATAQYVLDHASGGPVSFAGLTVPATAGDTFAAGTPVYLNSTNSRWYKLLANNSNFGVIKKYGISVGSGSAGVAITGGVSISGYLSLFSGLTPNSFYYVSDTGTLSTTPGTYIIEVGQAISASIVLLSEKFSNPATNGSQGVPSANNKFVTQDNVYDSETDQVQGTQNGTVSFGEANSTGQKNIITQSFIPTKTKTRGVKLYKTANTGTFTGDVTVALFADSAGSPTGSALATVTITNAVYNALSVGEFEAIFSAEYSMTAGTLYWLKVSSSTADNSNHPNLGTNTAGGYANGSVKYYNGTDGYVAIATIDLYFKTLQGVTGQINGPLVQVYSYSTTYTKPTGAKLIEIIVKGGGGGGGSGAVRTTTGIAGGGSGGGGGSIKRLVINASYITSETITIGAGGIGGASVSNPDKNGNNGNDGVNSSFGTWAVAYGGKAGLAGVNNGSASVPNIGGVGGGFATATTNGISEQGANGISGAVGSSGEYGGGAGGAGGSTSGTSSAQFAGGSSLYASGGGGGGGLSLGGGGGGVYNTAGAGGTSGSYSSGGGGAESTAGSPNSIIKRGYGASGGGGGHAIDSSSGVAGGAGGIGGGGGGGGSGGTSGGTSGKGGDGGSGEVIVITYF